MSDSGSLAPARVQVSGSLAEVSEIFSSLQGEGPYLGERHLFVRFGRCNMHCTYCDEVEKMKHGFFRDLSLEEAVERITKALSREGFHDAISLTGGEPLFYGRFLEDFLPRIREQIPRIYLETNGTMPRVLERLIHDVDIIAMDIKPPSSTQDRPYWQEHREFLNIAVQKEVFVKVVITRETCFKDIDTAMRIVKEVHREIPFIFQPQSELTGIDLKALGRIREYLTSASNHGLKNIRIIPQMHKIWGIR